MNAARVQAQAPTAPAAPKSAPKSEPKADTREAILKTASLLLQTRGYSGFSFADIAAALNVKPPAIHYHFATKAELGLALIARYTARYQRWMDEAEDQGLPPKQKLEGYLRIATRFADTASAEPGGKPGMVCPAGALEAEYGAIPPELQAAVARMVDGVYAWLARILDEGRKRGDFSFEGSAADMATFIASALQGGLQVGRALGRPRFDAVVRQIRKQLGV